MGPWGATAIPTLVTIPRPLTVAFLLPGASTDKPKYRDSDLAFGFRACAPHMTRLGSRPDDGVVCYVRGPVDEKR
jgi:hypothetical protein